MALNSLETPLPAIYPSAMIIVGHGIDIVETSRIRQMVEEHGQHFLDRCFTPLEQAYCDRSPKRRFEHLAGRFAAKEAVLKALGTGWRGGIAWTDIQIQTDPAGRPVVHLTGACQHLTREKGITQWLISISHIETHATASAIAVAEAPAQLKKSTRGSRG